MTNPLDSLSSSGSGLKITGEIATYLKETGGWAKFLSILGFVFVGLIVIIAFFIGGFMSMMGMPDQLAGMEVFATILYLLIAALYFFPILFLFQFGTRVREALKSEDTATLTAAFGSLKSHYKFIGILMAIFMALYAVILAFVLIAAAMA